MTAGGDVVSSSAAIPAGIAPVVARFLWCFLWSFLCGDSIDDRSWRATQRGRERPRYKHTTLLYSLAVKVFEFPPSRRLVRVCRGKFVRSSEPSGDFALTGRSPRVSLLLDKLLSPKSLLSDSHPSRLHQQTFFQPWTLGITFTKTNQVFPFRPTGGGTTRQLHTTRAQRVTTS